MTVNRLNWLVLLAFAITLGPWVKRPVTAAPPEGSEFGRGPIVNLAADGMVGCLVPPRSIDGSHSREELFQAYHSLVDYYARAQVPYLFLNVCYMRAACPSDAWDRSSSIMALNSPAFRFPSATRVS